MNILVFGGSGGIGAAVISAAKSRGHLVAAPNRDEIDLANVSEVEEKLPPIIEQRGPFDAMVYAAGVCKIKPVKGIEAAELVVQMNVNVNSFILAAKLFAKQKRDGRIVAISSVSAREGWAGGTAYCAGKGALSAACRAMREEGMKVEYVEPKWILTRMFREGAGRMGVPESAARKPEDVAEEIMRLI